MKHLIAILLLLAACPIYGQERALVEYGTGEVLKTEAPPQTQPSARWLPVIRQARPAITADQRLERQVAVVDDTVVISWTVVDLTPEEIAARDAAAADAADRTTKRQNVGNAVATLRQWSDDAEATTVTSGNAVAVLQAMVNRLGIFFDRFADLVEAQGLDQ